MAYIYNIGRLELYRQIRKNAGFISGKVLDVGAGGFSRYKELFNYEKYIKMDVLPNKNIDIVGNIEAIPFPDDYFDSIICTQVLGDVYELSKAFKEIYRVLKTNGIILITENLFDSLHDEPNDYWRFTQYSFRQLINDAGLKVEVLDPYGGYWSVMAQMRARYWIERIKANNILLIKLINFIFKIFGNLAIFLDHIDKSHANQLFVRGYVIIARKHA